LEIGAGLGGSRGEAGPQALYPCGILSQVHLVQDGPRPPGRSEGPRASAGGTRIGLSARHHPCWDRSGSRGGIGNYARLRGGWLNGPGVAGIKRATRRGRCPPARWRPLAHSGADSWTQPRPACRSDDCTACRLPPPTCINRGPSSVDRRSERPRRSWEQSMSKDNQTQLPKLDDP
jgi:hypothetical protein